MVAFVEVFGGYADYGTLSGGASGAASSGGGSAVLRRSYPKAPVGYDRAYYHVIDGPGGYREIWAYPVAGGEPEIVGVEDVMIGVGAGNPNWPYTTATKMKWALWALLALGGVYAYKKWGRKVGL